MKEKLETMKFRYEEIETMMLDPEVTKDLKLLTKLSKEHASLKVVIDKYNEYLDALSNIEEAKELLSDPEMKEFAEEEIATSKNKVALLEDEIQVLLIPKDENDDKDVIVEIRGAAGGDEANIFAGDLYRMYSKYAEAKGWKIAVLNSEYASNGGFSQIEFSVSGDNVYSFLKYESGSHRVQRIPATESNGRIHTSTATVLVMPEVEDIEVELNMNEVRIDTFCSSGPGGQSVNTTKSAVRATHEPTGIVASCQDGKSQHENKAAAIKMLRVRLYDHINQEKLEAEGAERKSKLGTGDRSEKIRTYNYPQNRVTDHRINFTIQQLDRVVEGRLDSIIDALITEEIKRKLGNEES
ncbi:MAG: peptide chain release factor 1 [Bacilli bacterium]